MGLEEDRYEHIDILIKSPAEGDPWYDRIFDFITSFCEPIGERDEEGNVEGCTCGMESMGGSIGTLDQCYDHMRITEKWAIDVRADDLKYILAVVKDRPGMVGDLGNVYDRLHAAAYWHDDFNERYSNLSDDEEEEFELDPEVAPYFSDEPLPATVLGHLEHYQHCNCLGDSGVCCQDGCWCQEEIDDEEL